MLFEVTPDTRDGMFLVELYSDLYSQAGFPPVRNGLILRCTEGELRSMHETIAKYIAIKTVPY